LERSAGRKAQRTPKSAAIAARSRSIASGSPKPLMPMSAPAAAMPRATERPIPLVEPVTRATRPSSVLAVIAFSFAAFANSLQSRR